LALAVISIAPAMYTFEGQTDIRMGARK
jgi:hypothetical protein